jgi:hypothetical protein
MAVASVVSPDISAKINLKFVESEMINTPKHKRKGCFGSFSWIRFWKRKKVSTIQTNNIKYGILLTA